MDKLITNIEEIPRGKSVVVFDLDGTLAESKVGIDIEMGDLLMQLMAKHRVAVIGGGSFEQLLSQIPANILSATGVLGNLFLLPLNGGSFYTYKDEAWMKIYSQNLTEEEKNKIITAFESAFKDVSYNQPVKIYGEIIEDRGSQITFSALGQHAPLEEKEKWAKENNDKRLELEAKLKTILPEMEFQVAGLTSIDVTKKGIDKRYGIEQIIKYVGMTIDDVLFFGDALESDGNDHPALEAGAACFKVNSIQDTKDAVKYLLELSDN